MGGSGCPTVKGKNPQSKKSGGSGWKFISKKSGRCGNDACKNRIDEGEEVYCLQQGDVRIVMCLECAYEEKLIDE